ncbi:MAG: hypothetical protein JST19_22590 [Bacteroidetes bacterium]|nr:hypothetical protein [Bacteroidota bacterium]
MKKFAAMLMLSAFTFMTVAASAHTKMQQDTTKKQTTKKDTTKKPPRR